MLALASAACGSGETADTPDDTSTETTAATGSGDEATTTAPADDSTTTAPTGSGSEGAGSATLTVGDQVFTFDNYYCRVGAANTQNANISFSSGAFGEVDGNRAQLDASIYDGDGQDRMEGDGVIASVTFNDVADFDNPKVSLSAESGMQATPVVFEFDGSTLRVETTFDDGLTDEMDEIPGVLEATCGQ